MPIKTISEGFLYLSFSLHFSLSFFLFLPAFLSWYSLSGYRLLPIPWKSSFYCFTNITEGWDYLEVLTSLKAFNFHSFFCFYKSDNYFLTRIMWVFNSLTLESDTDFIVIALLGDCLWSSSKHSVLYFVYFSFSQEHFYTSRLLILNFGCDICAKNYNIITPRTVYYEHVLVGYYRQII